ncbi:twin-arginine translocase TatA/TatE family subunit [Zunongwangia atlantica]|uniref:Sec-independent protein translocase TatA/E n=1 Tax=Zunongwangia atlantica 22II14-10F7 TaxID=1185767 RepID=A0A1Y1SXU9_9FLAO|nr:twin-arginine translocase TatA/TatE family subunit [Zunongwangia atlantica]ORL43567.1 Sec-independent protein translocase TatA/E [Zunongwangia atlantica 22II14-10F7]
MKTIYFISGAEIAFTVFVTILIFGADKAPGIIKNLNKVYKSIKNTSQDIKNEIYNQSEKSGLNSKVFDDLKKEVSRIKDKFNNL